MNEPRSEAPAPSGQTKVEVVTSAMAAWAANDVEGMLRHVTPDIEWHYQVGSKPVHGIDGMRKLLGRLKDHQLNSQWRLVRHAENGDTLMIEAVDDYTNPDGHRVRVPYMGVYEFHGPLIRAWRDYLDLGVMMNQEAGEAPAPWLVPLVED